MCVYACVCVCVGRNDPRHLFYIQGYNDIDDNDNDEDSDEIGYNDNDDGKLIMMMTPRSVIGLQRGLTVFPTVKLKRNQRRTDNFLQMYEVV